MALTLWLFWTYSFLGYLLEKAFAWLTRSPQQVRKCFLLLPLCPVYGLEFWQCWRCRRSYGGDSGIWRCGAVWRPQR